MKLSFTLHPYNQPEQTISLEVTEGLVAGWVGRDMAAIEEHIEELAQLGVPRPSAVPLFYRIAGNQFIQSNTIQVVGEETSGEAETIVFMHNNELWVSLGSDHTDRKLETHSVALSKQICAKPVARDAWRMQDVQAHWDKLQLRAWIEEDGKAVLYQEGALATLLSPQTLIEDFFNQPTMRQGALMTCGTVAAIGGIRPSAKCRMELSDPILNRRIQHEYTITPLPEIA